MSGNNTSSAPRNAFPLHLPPIVPWAAAFPLPEQQRHASHRVPKQHTPKLFYNRKLRSGKWIPEEEKYALAMIQLFEQGRIEGCENGCTLRSFLSQKLHCAPMRISKKFAGKGIGKMVYMSKLKEQPQQNKEHEKLVKKVQELAEQFHNAVFPQKDAMGVHTMGGYLNPLAAPPSSLRMIPGLPGMPPMVAPRTPALPFPFVAPFPLVPVATQPVAATTTTTATASTEASSTGDNDTKPAAAASTASSSPSPPASTAAGSIAESQDKLRESFLNALHQTQQQQQRTPATARASSTTAATEPTKTATTKAATTSSCEAFSMLPPAESGIKPEPPTRSLIKPLTPSDLPDFLSGFEAAKQAKSVTTTTSSTTSSAPSAVDTATDSTTDQNNNWGTGQAAPSQYSPPFTSRSFDDFHRFLGKDLHLVESAASATSTTATATTTTTTVPDTSALFTAESYAMFAQESALAASQHDAYLTAAATTSLPAKSSSPSTTQGQQQFHHGRVRDSFDIDGVVQMVAEHVNYNNLSKRQEAKSNSGQVHQGTTTTSKRSTHTTTTTTTSRLQTTRTPSVIPSRAPNTVDDLQFVVSASEPSERSSTEDSALEGESSTSRSGGSSSDNNTNEESSDSGDSCDSSKRGRCEKSETSMVRPKRVRLPE